MGLSAEDFSEVRVQRIEPDLFQHFPLKPWAQIGWLHLDPSFEFLAGRQELFPSRWVAVAGITAHLVARVAQPLLEPVSDPHALQISLPQLGSRRLGPL